MKTSIKIIVTVILTFGFVGITHAQKGKNHQWKHNCSMVTTSKSITLESSSKNEAITIPVDNETGCLSIGVSSSISSGSLTLEIYNPDGDKEGNFSVSGDDNSSSSNEASMTTSVCGQLNKTFKEPMKGDWVVKLKPKKVTGKIQIHSNQSTNNEG